MNIQSVMRQIQEKTTLANDNLKDATNNTRPVREAQKRAAQEALQGLKNDCRKLLLSSAVYLVVTGPQTNELMELANNEPKCFGSDSEALYNKILARVDPRAYENKQFVPSILDTISNSLEEVALDCGIQSYPMLRFKAEYSKTITSKEQLLDIVKDAVNTNVGGEMVGIFTVSNVLDQIVERRHIESFVPVVLSAADEQLAITLSKDLKRLSPNTFLVTTGKPTKATKGLQNMINLKEASKEALDQLLSGVKGKVS